MAATCASVFGSFSPTLFKPNSEGVSAFFFCARATAACLCAERSSLLYPRMGALSTLAMVHLAHSRGASDSLGEHSGGEMRWAPRQAPG